METKEFPATAEIHSHTPTHTVRLAFFTPVEGVDAVPPVFRQNQIGFQKLSSSFPLPGGMDSTYKNG
jgi:hypothetical protein